MKDVISVVMCAYNAESTISKAIQSVLSNKTLCKDGGDVYSFDFHLIIIDDGSSDRTPEIINLFKDKDPRIISFRWENHGLSCSREKALEFIKGDYVAFCDSDDWVEPDWLMSMYKTAINHDADIVRYRGILENVKVQYNPNEVNIWGPREAIYEFFEHKKITAMLQTELIRSILFYDVHFDTSLRNWEDQSVALQLLSKAKKIVRVNDAKYHYFVNNQGISNGKTNIKRIIDSFKVMDAHVRFCEKEPYNIFYEMACKFRRKWMFVELKSMYRWKVYDDSLERRIINLYRNKVITFISELKWKDKLFFLLIMINRRLAKKIATIV